MLRLLKNLSANGLGVFISLTGQIFAVPLFLHVWSTPLYGEWLVLFTVPSLLMSLEGSLGGIAASRMTLAAAKNNWVDVNEIFQTTLLGQICVSAFIFVATLIGLSAGNVQTFFKFHHLNPWDTEIIFMVLVCYMLGGLFLSLYRAPYRASELEARGSMLVNCWRISDFIITVTVLIFHGGPVCLAECLLVGVVLWILIGYRDVNQKCSQVHFAFTHLSRHRFRELIIDGLPLLASQTATAFYMQGYPLIVNKMLGPTPVVMLTTIRMLCRLGLLTVQTMAWSCSPLLSRSYGAEDWPKYYRLLRVLLATSLWAGTIGLIGYTLLGPWVFNLWLRGKLQTDHLTMFLFSLSISLQGVWICLSSMLGSSRKHHEFNYAYAAGTLLTLCAVPWLMVRMGFIAVPIMMSLADFAFVIVGLFLCRQKLTQFHLNEITPILRFSFYRKEVAFVLNWCKQVQGSRVREKPPL